MSILSKQVSSNRWFVWAITFTIAVGIALWGYIEYTNIIGF